MKDGSTPALTTDHAMSSDGVPVLVVDGEVYGPGDVLPDGCPAAAWVQDWSRGPERTPEELEMAGRFLLSSRPELERTAYHEAAHAVVAWMLWRPFEYVTIIPEQDSLGHMKNAYPRVFDDQTFCGNFDTAAIDQGAICLAGYIANAYQEGNYYPSLEDVTARLSVDDGLAIDAACDHSSSEYIQTDDGPTQEVTPAMEKMFETADLIVIHNWGPIKAVAQALLVKKTLTWAEVFDIAQKAPTAHTAHLQSG